MSMQKRACLSSIWPADQTAGACPSNATLLAATPAADGSKLQIVPSTLGRPASVRVGDEEWSVYGAWKGTGQAWLPSDITSARPVAGCDFWTELFFTLLTPTPVFPLRGPLQSRDAEPMSRWRSPMPR